MVSPLPGSFNGFQTSPSETRKQRQTVIRTERQVVVVDTCSGNHRDRPTFPPAHQLETQYLGNLLRARVRHEEVDFVMCTHLRADHGGWNTCERGGR